MAPERIGLVMISVVHGCLKSQFTSAFTCPVHLIVIHDRHNRWCLQGLSQRDEFIQNLFIHPIGFFKPINGSLHRRC
jgi:hypothetical protein